jgi:hypothetical protein
MMEVLASQGTAEKTVMIDESHIRVRGTTLSLRSHKRSEDESGSLIEWKKAGKKTKLQA